MIGDSADRRGPRDESVFIVMPAVVVEVADKRELAGVTFPNQVLPKDVRDVNLLRSRFELVQVRIRIFLAHVEGGEIVLPTIVVVVPENADAEVRVVENETAKIANERLHADAHRYEIVI